MQKDEIFKPFMNAIENQVVEEESSGSSSDYRFKTKNSFARLITFHDKFIDNQLRD
jgi:hypothetical protein